MVYSYIIFVQGEKSTETDNIVKILTKDCERIHRTNLQTEQYKIIICIYFLNLLSVYSAVFQYICNSNHHATAEYVSTAYSPTEEITWEGSCLITEDTTVRHDDKY